MDQLVSSTRIIDEKELKAFDTYAWRLNHMSEKTGIPDYEECW